MDLKEIVLEEFPTTCKVMLRKAIPAASTVHSNLNTPYDLSRNSKKKKGILYVQLTELFFFDHYQVSTMFVTCYFKHNCEL